VQAGPEVAWEADDRDAGSTLAGPAVVHLPEATLVVPAGWRGRIDATGTILLQRNGREEQA
jgi:N-methylhydantoinase A